MKTTNLKWIFLVAFAILVFNACEEETPEYTPPDSSFGLIYTKILTPTCSVNGCHDGTTTSPELIGESTYSNMVTSDVANAQAENAGLHLVMPFTPDSSFLYQKLIYSTSAFQFGSPMPQGGLTLTDDAIEFVRQWIEAGAPLAGHVADRTLIE